MHVVLVLTRINCDKSDVYILFLIFSRRLWCSGSVKYQQKIKFTGNSIDKVHKNIQVKQWSDLAYFTFGVLYYCVDLEHQLEASMQNVTIYEKHTSFPHGVHSSRSSCSPHMVSCGQSFQLYQIQL